MHTMPEHAERRGSTSAKVLYRPFGMASSIVGGVVAGVVFKQVWKRIRSDDRSDSPKALESEYALREVLAAAALQGAIFAVVKAAIERGGARVFQRWTGDWPGD